MEPSPTSRMARGSGHESSSRPTGESEDDISPPEGHSTDDQSPKERHMANNKKGTGLLMVWTDVPADKEQDFNRWYNEEHLAERLAIPGFLSAARYEAVKGHPKHLAYYELESPAVLESEAYKQVSANP